MKVTLVAAVSRGLILGWGPVCAVHPAEKLTRVDRKRVCYACGSPPREIVPCLPWAREDYPEHTDRLRTLTAGQAVIVGARTAQALGSRWPMPGRHCFQVTDAVPALAGTMVHTWSPDMQTALEACEDFGLDAYVLGGRKTFQAALPRATHLEITWIDAQHRGTVRFPGTFQRRGVWYDTPDDSADVYSSFELVHSEYGRDPRLTFTTWKTTGVSE